MASRASVTIDADEAMAQRRELLAQGYYCIGLWHTHPAKKCEPSGQDRRLASDHALAARSVLNGLAFVIVGDRPFPDGWYIGVHDGTEFHRAHLIEDSKAETRDPNSNS
jgi:proteasome lid subunit RPN8/RPN11